MEKNIECIPWTRKQLYINFAYWHRTVFFFGNRTFPWIDNGNMHVNSVISSEINCQKLTDKKSEFYVNSVTSSEIKCQTYK